MTTQSVGVAVLQHSSPFSVPGTVVPSGLVRTVHASPSTPNLMRSSAADSPVAGSALALVSDGGSASAAQPVTAARPAAAMMVKTGIMSLLFEVCMATSLSNGGASS